MNNKGQALVIFVIILPIVLMIFTLIVDFGFLYVEKRNINNNVYDSVEYYLNNIEDEEVLNKTEQLLNKNIKNIEDIKITENDEYVEIYISKTRKSLYSIITHDTKISVNYIGYKENKEIIKG